MHSGDSACSIPPQTIPREILNEIKNLTTLIAKKLKIIGFLNIQFALKDEKLYVLEVNPRASRTVPFISKAIGLPTNIATK